MLVAPTQKFWFGDRIKRMRLQLPCLIQNANPELIFRSPTPTEGFESGKRLDAKKYLQQITVARNRCLGFETASFRFLQILGRLRRPFLPPGSAFQPFLVCSLRRGLLFGPI